MKWIFLPIQSGKPWNGMTIHNDSLGGSEAAVAYLAKSLASLGETVHVMTHGGQQSSTQYNGVWYHPNSNFGNLLTQDWDVVVSSRWIEILEQPWRTRYQLMWIHDLNPYGSTAPKIRANRVVGLSEYQLNSWGLTPQNSVIIGNGWDEKYLSGLDGVIKDPNRLIWTSNPDRGLPIAAMIFQEIRKRWPSMELHVYGRSAVYGWGPEVEAPYLPREEHMTNVYVHDPLPRQQLFRELKKSWAMFYPTYWPETYCIATLEAQACGTPVIASPLAALNETVKGGILTYDYLNAVSQLRNQGRYSKLASLGTQFAKDNTWDKQAVRWIELIGGLNG